MKRILIIALAVLVSACEAPAIDTHASGNVEIRVDHIANIEDCHVYRFEDGGYLRYVTICPDRQRVTTEGAHSNGKYTSPDGIETIRKPTTP